MATVRSIVLDSLLRLRAAARRPALRGRTLRIFLEPDDPYSTLLASATTPLCDDGHPLEVHIVASRSAEFDPDPERRLQWSLIDCARLARRFDLSFPDAPTRPADPLTDRATAILARPRTPAEQLHAFREVGVALWGGDARRIAELAGTLGSTDDYGALVRSTDRLERLGHYRGGMIWYAGEWFWALDRLDALTARLGRSSLLPAPRPLDASAHGRPTALEFWFSFRSPYSYLAVERTRDLAEAADVPLTVRPVLPMVMRGLAVPFRKRLDLAEDSRRAARELGIPFGRIADPLGSGVERCMAIAGYAEEQGALLEFMVSAGRAIWSEGIDVATDSGLSHVIERAGLDWTTARERLDDESWREPAETNRQALLDAGFWGVPCFRVTYEDGTRLRFWGQDRLQQLAEALGAETALAGPPRPE